MRKCLSQEKSIWSDLNLESCDYVVYDAKLKEVYGHDKGGKSVILDWGTKVQDWNSRSR